MNYSSVPQIVLLWGADRLAPQARNFPHLPGKADCAAVDLRSRAGGRDRASGAAVSAARSSGSLGPRCRFLFSEHGFAGGHTALARVVVHIPAGTHKFEPRSSQQPLQRPTTLRTLLLGFAAEMLNLFKSIATFYAAIRIQRQGLFHLNIKYPTLLLYRVYGKSVQTLPVWRSNGMSAIFPQRTCRPLPTASFQCTVTDTDAPSFSHSSVIVPRFPPWSLIVHAKFSTSAADLVIFIFTRPKSFVLS